MHGHWQALIVVILLCTLSVEHSEQRPQQREKRQFDFNNFVLDPAQQRRANLRRQFQLHQERQQPGAELVFSTNQGTTTPAPRPQPTAAAGGTAPTTPNTNNGQVVFVNNQPIVVTMAPFVERTTPTPQFIRCFNTCPTTPEYNPICASNQELYFNEQKFNCAQRCGADIQIVRRGSCEGLFPMLRG